MKVLFSYLKTKIHAATAPTKPLVAPQPIPIVVNKPAPTTSWNPPVTVAVVNGTTVLTDAQITPVVAAIQTQVTRDFAPVWAVDAKVIQVSKGQPVPAGTWPVYLLDTSDAPGALGYHDDSTGVPYSRVFVKTDMENGAAWSITLSHEVLEMLADPFICSVVLDPKTNRVYALEVCDAPEADQFGYQINNVAVSNFVYPAWFGAAGNKFDHKGLINAPFKLLTGGYISYVPVVPQGNWKQITAEINNIHPHREKITPGSRRHRRTKTIKTL
jgi:hypothetical protein